MRKDSFQAAEKNRVKAVSEELADLVHARLAGIPIPAEDRIISDGIAFMTRLYQCELLISGQANSITFENPLETIQTCRVAAQILHKDLNISDIAHFFAKSIELLELLKHEEHRSVRESEQYSRQMQDVGKFAVSLWSALQEEKTTSLEEDSTGAVRRRTVSLG